MKNIISFVKRRLYLSLLILAVVVLLVYKFFPRDNRVAAQEFTVHRGTITQEVSVTGKTKPVTDIELAFERSGKISRVPAKIGDHVQIGQELAALDNTELAAQYAEAQATVQIQKAKLAELQRGSRPEDIQIKQTALKKAEQDLANDYQAVSDVLNDAYVKADDAVRKQIDELFTRDEESSPQLTFAVSDSQIQVDAESRRVQASTELKKWKKELDQIVTHSSDQNLLDNDVRNVKNHLIIIRDFLNRAMDAVTNAANLSQSTATTYKTSITTARTNVGTAITAVNTQEQTISSEKITVAKTQDELNLSLAGTAPEQIAAQEAQVRQAEANAQVKGAQIAKGIIRSPIAGVVTKQEAKLGQIAQANTPLVSVISSDQLEIEANVPEADAAKISIGDPVAITLDAFGDSTRFSGSVLFIDPAETVIEGVSTYKTTIQLQDKNPAIKPGLTANLTIVTETKENVLLIPQQAVIYRGDKRFVLVPEGGNKSNEVEITLGVRGSDGNVEVLSGLEENASILQSPE